MQSDETGNNYILQDNPDCLNKINNNKQINFNSINVHLQNLG
jgi:hypothetical protein